jgi:hypothetical protein
MKKKLFVISVMALLMYTKLFSKDWVYIGKDNYGDIYYCQSTHVSKGSSFKGQFTYRVWTKKICKSSYIIKGNKKIKVTNVTEKALREYDCINKRTKFISTVIYNSKSEVIYSYKPSEHMTDFEDVIPDSIGESLLEKICELFY